MRILGGPDGPVNPYAYEGGDAQVEYTYYETGDEVVYDGDG